MSDRQHFDKDRVALREERSTHHEAIESARVETLAMERSDATAVRYDVGGRIGSICARIHAVASMSANTRSTERRHRYRGLVIPPVEHVRCELWASVSTIQ
jgi:hypothetical protein